MLRAWAVIAIAIVALGCDVLGGRSFDARFPVIDGDPDGTVDVAAVPIRLQDMTGTVTGVEIAEGRREELLADLIEGRVTAVPGRPDALRIAWLGGACEQDVTLRLSADDDRFRLSIKANRGFALFQGCPSIGIGRAVVIEFGRPIEPIDVFVSVDVG